MQRFAIFLRKKRIPEGGGVAGGQAGRGDLKPLRHSDWPSRRRGRGPSLLCGARTQQHSSRHGHAPEPLPACWAAASWSSRPHPLPNYLKGHSKAPVSVLGAGVFVFPMLYSEKAQWFRPMKPAKMEKPNWVRGSYGISCLEPSALYKNTVNIYLERSV